MSNRIRVLLNKISELGLAYKLILFIFFSIALIFTIIFWYNYEISRKIVVKHIRQNAEYLTTASVLKVDKVLSTVRKIPENYARIIESYTFNDDDYLVLLKEMMEANPEIYGTALAFEPYFLHDTLKYHAPYYYRDGGDIAYKNIGTDQYDYFTMDWYQIPRELRKPVWSEPYFDEGAGNVLMATYSVPVFKTIDGLEELIGILTIDISLDWLRELMGAVKVCETGYAFMISGIGVMITHPNKELVLNETVFSIADAQQSPMLREIGRNMIRGKSSFAEFEYRNIITGKLSWIAYAPLSANNWSVGIVFPVDELMEDVNNLYINLIVLVLGGLLIIFIVIVVISRSITRPLRFLTQAAGNFAHGNFNIPLLPIRLKDEIGRLNTSFIYMQERLVTTMSDLQDALTRLRVSNERLEEYNRTLEEKVEARTLELKEKNKELDASFNNIRTLNEIGREITSTLQFETIQEKVYEHVHSLLDASGFLIMIYNNEQQVLECKFAVEKGIRLPAFNISMEEKNRFPVWSVENKAPVFMNDIEKEYHRYVTTRAVPKSGESVESLIYIPLMIEQQVVGVISTQSFHKNAYSEYQFDMLNNLANFIAIAFDNALSYEKINKAHCDLKAAQAQLVQSEKMASLGQLTAGIAHEIKNPLNFVNNFAELTIDMVDELDEEIGKMAVNLNEKEIAYLKEVIGDIRMNTRRIRDHGKRADSIVKGMLLHSRGQAGEKQPTDINAVLAEYINLGYHGMRAQDANFNIKIEADYDPAIGKINVIPQNLSRVFLNIINNACYSTLEKKKQLKDAYFPELTVTTKNGTDHIEIRIRDNGKGIPPEVLDKVFNPFFTTKPPGQGTGLGLSLSYDIVVQEHRGSLVVDSVEGEFAEFIITIPKNLLKNNLSYTQ